MKVYADTGFVVSLYKVETTSPAAAALMAQLQAPIWLSQLGQLELHNAFQLAIFRSEIDTAAALRKKLLFAEDMARGVFAIQLVPAVPLYQNAMALAELHSAALGTRSMDLLHVAAAKLLKVDLFLTFDARQRQVAEMEGMTVGP